MYPLVLAFFAFAALPATAAVTKIAEYHLGEAGSLGVNSRPQDSVGTYHYTGSNDSGSTPSATTEVFASDSSAYLDTSDTTRQEGFWGPTFFVSDSFAFGIFVRAAANTSTTRGNVFSIGGPSTKGVLKLALESGGWSGSAYNTAWIGPQFGTGFVANQWVHLALIRSAGVTTFYIDGVAQSGTWSGTPVVGESHLSVDAGGATAFDGQIDEARVVTFTAGESISNILLALTGPAPPPAPEPAIVTQPTSVAIPEGDSASFVVHATGDPVLTYRWFKSPENTLISEATTDTLTFANASAADVGSYYVTVTNSLGSVSSNPAQLTLTLAPAPSSAPSATQQAQIHRKYGMFCHFSINTFANQEWTDGSLPATTFAPTAVDADQWVLTAKAAGMRYLLLTTKHHDGFCLWDSAWTTYDVASSAVPSMDVVQLVSDACARHGIRFAIYYSLWDRHESSYSNPAAYVIYMKRQLTELMSRYGPVAEIWLDGGWERPSADWNIPELYHVVKTLQPECQFTVNWTIGLPSNADASNVQPTQQETGYPIRYFPSDFRTADPYMPKFPDPKVFTHKGNNYYFPLEATVTTNVDNHWFFNTGSAGTKSLSFLENTFNTATAQNNLLVLNAAPNRDGVIPPESVTVLTQLAHRLGLEADRPHPVNLTNAATITAKSTWADAGYEPAKACDEDPNTRWSAAAGDLAPWLQIDFGASTRFDRVIVNEYGESGIYRCSSFNLQAWNGSSWEIIHTGSTLGESLRIDLPAPVTSEKLRLQILSSTSPVSIWMLKVQDSARPNPAQSSYRLWQEQYFSLSEINAGNADPSRAAANDGVANALKFALGINDVRHPYSGSSMTPLVPRSGDSPLFTFQRAHRDARYTVQSSENLVQWDTLATDPGSVGSLVSVEFPPSTSHKSFLRLNVDPEP